MAWVIWRKKSRRIIASRLAMAKSSSPMRCGSYCDQSGLSRSISSLATTSAADAPQQMNVIEKNRSIRSSYQFHM